MTEEREVSAGEREAGRRHIQEQVHAEAVRLNNERTKKLEAATRLLDDANRTPDPVVAEAKSREASRLFREAGASAEPAEAFRYVGPPLGEAPGDPPMPDLRRYPGFGAPRPPPTQAPPWREAGEPPGLDVAAIVAAFAPILTALLERKGSGGSSERREAFQRYAYVAMASGKTWAEAHDLANDLLDCEDLASRPREEEHEPAGPEAPSGLGAVGLCGEAG